MKWASGVQLKSAHKSTFTGTAEWVQETSRAGWL